MEERKALDKEKSRKKLRVRENPAKAKRNKKKRQLKPLLFGIFSFLITLMIISRQIYIGQLKNDLEENERIIAQKSAERDDLERRLAPYKKASHIEKEAKDRLGMVYPEEGKKYYISVKEPEKEEEETYKFSNSLRIFFSGIFN